MCGCVAAARAGRSVGRKVGGSHALTRSTVVVVVVEALVVEVVAVVDVSAVGEHAAKSSSRAMRQRFTDRSVARLRPVVASRIGGAPWI